MDDLFTTNQGGSKRKGVMDATRSKQEASGDRNSSMLNICDVSVATVKPAKDTDTCQQQ